MNERYVPEGSVAVERPELKAVVYKFVNRNGKPAARGYSGKRGKPDFKFYFLSEELRSQYIEKYFDGKEKSIQFKKDCKVKEKIRKAEFLKTVKVGQIMRCSWGYDQTNIDFYEVTKVKGSTVTIRHLQQRTTETGFMSGTTIPLPGQYRGEEIKKIVRGNYLSASHGCITPWDGEPESCSWYA